MGDGCQLECVKPFKPKIHEFIGPVKIVLVEQTRKDERLKLCGAACIALSLMLMGATSLTMLAYTLTFVMKFPCNSHIMLCTIGYQLCIPVGILNLNPWHGPAMVLNRRNRVLEHVITQIIGLLCGVGGSVVILLLGTHKIFELKGITPHFISGAAAGFFAALGILFGPLAYCLKVKWAKPFIKVHSILGVLAFVSSSVCFLTGIFKPVLNTWWKPWEMVVFYGVFCLIYTAVVIYIPISNWCAKEKDEIESI